MVKIIIVKLIGGLGNQMFQYAAGRGLAYVNNMELKLDISGFESYDLWNYELGNYSIREEFATEEDLKNVVNSKFKVDNIIDEFFFLFRNRMSTSKREESSKIYYYKEKYFHFDPELSEQKKSVYLDGYWQSEKYFKHIEKIIKSDFTLKNDMNDLNSKISEKIQSSSSVSLHVRRGDYVSNPKAYEIYGLCSLDYYKRAVDIICSKISNPHFFIFSDDPEWVRENISLHADVDYVTNNTSCGYEDLRLMSLCDHHIIANSSFSWWGAWLSKKEDGIVIAPDKWFDKSKNNTKDLLPDLWLKIKK